MNVKECRRFDVDPSDVERFACCGVNDGRKGLVFVCFLADLAVADEIETIPREGGEMVEMCFHLGYRREVPGGV